MSIEAEFRKMMNDALANLPSTLEYEVHGEEALLEHVKANPETLLDVTVRLLPVLSAGIVLLAKEVDALKALIEAQPD